MRIALVELYGVGGTADYTDCLAQALSVRGHEVSVITSSLFEPLQEQPGFHVSRVFHYRTSDPKIAKAVRLARSLGAVRKAIRAAQPEIIHAQGTVIPALDRRLYDALGPALRVCTVHDVEAHERRRVLGSFTRFYGVFDALVCHSHASRQRLNAALPSSRVTVIPHGRYTPLATTIHDAQRSRVLLRLPADAHVVLFFGYLRPYKGLDVLLQALALARRKCPSVVGLIAGRPMYDVSSMRRRAEREGVSLRWDLRYIPRHESGLYFAAADVVALPYVETSDSGMIELAAAFHRPVVVTSAGGLSEAFSRYGFGTVVPERDAAALAEAIVRRYEPVPSSTIVTNSWDDVAGRTESLYGELIELAAPASARRGAA